MLKQLIFSVYPYKLQYHSVYYNNKLALEIRYGTIFGKSSLLKTESLVLIYFSKLCILLAYLHYHHTHTVHPITSVPAESVATGLRGVAPRHFVNFHFYALFFNFVMRMDQFGLNGL